MKTVVIHYFLLLLSVFSLTKVESKPSLFLAYKLLEYQERSAHANRNNYNIEHRVEGEKSSVYQKVVRLARKFSMPSLKSPHSSSSNGKEDEESENGIEMTSLSNKHQDDIMMESL